MFEKGIYSRRRFAGMVNVEAKTAAEQSLYTDDCLENVIEKHSNMVYRLALSQY